MKQNLHFKQLQLNYIKQPPKTKKEHMKLVIVSIGVDAVAKIDDEVYVLIIIKTYCYFLFVLLLILQWIFACLLRTATKKKKKKQNLKPKTFSISHLAALRQKRKN